MFFSSCNRWHFQVCLKPWKDSRSLTSKHFRVSTPRDSFLCIYVLVRGGGANKNHSSPRGVEQTEDKDEKQGVREWETQTETETQHQRGRETQRRQSTSGHTQLRHGHHEWLKADFPFWQAYQSLHSVMEAKVNQAWSTAFASGNHQRDVFKESSGDREEEQWNRKGFFYHYGLFKWGILPVYPAAEGNRHFVWGHPVNVPPTGGRSGGREGCDSLFRILQESEGRDPGGKGENWPDGPVRTRTEMNRGAGKEMETINSHI